MVTKDSSDFKGYSVRQSMIFPVSSVLLLQIIFFGIDFFLATIYGFASTIFTRLEFQSWVFWSSVLLKAINIILVGNILLSWFFTWYTIKPREYILHKGILRREAITFEFDHLDKISIEQGVLGRIFNYGSISIYNHDLRKNVYIHDIPNPKIYAQKLLSLAV